MDKVLEFGLAASRGLALRAQPAPFGVFSEGEGVVIDDVWCDGMLTNHMATYDLALFAN
jgi:hypothetical protein